MKILTFIILLLTSIFLSLTPLSIANHHPGPTFTFAQEIDSNTSSDSESNNILIAEYGKNRVIEINKNSGSIIWQVTGYDAFCAYRLRNGNTIICDWDRVVEVNSIGTVVWSFKIPGDKIAGDAFRLPNGNTLISVIDYPNYAPLGSGVIEIKPNGDEVWSEWGLHNPTQAVRLPPRENPRDNSPQGSTLMAHGTSRIYEKSMEGNVIWQKYLSHWAGTLQRLPNLNTLVGESVKIEEIDYNGNLVWSVSEGLSRITSVQRLSNDNTLVSDLDNNRVIELSPNGDIVWSRTGLIWPYTARLINDYPPPYLYQTAIPWKDDYYGNVKESNYDIEGWGCYMTSAAMIINHFGQRSDSSFTTDPGTLNYWLQEKDGYMGKGDVDRSRIVEYANDNNVPLRIDEYIPTQNDPLLDFYLFSGSKAIIGVKESIDPDDGRHYAAHFVVGLNTTEYSGIDTYDIFDPIYGRTTLYEQYNNQYYSALILSTEPGSNATISFSAHSPIELIVTDPLGRKSGYDPDDGKFWDDIPDAEYHLRSIISNGGQGEASIPSKEFFALNPIVGEYKIEILGIGDGSFEVNLITSNNLGTVFKESYLGTASTGSLEKIIYDYDPNRGVIYLPLSLKR